MAELPTSAVIRYSSYTFPSNVETTAYHCRPQYDQAGRTTVYNEITLTLRAIITGTNIDAAVRAVEQVLTKPAYQFVYAGSGCFQSINVGSVRDVVWGPKPTGFSFKPLGGGNAAEITWSVKVCIPDWPSARFETSPLELGYTVSYDVDASGYTTRNFNGYVIVPTTRANPTSRTLSDSADRLRESITPALLPGFRRASHSAHLSLDKQRLDLTVVDQQLPPNIPPAGIVECSASSAFGSIPGTLDTKWQGHIEGTYEIARNGKATMADAIQPFFAMVRDRLAHTKETLARLNPVLSSSGQAKEPTVMPVSFSMSEPEIYGRTKVKLGLTYFVGGTDLASMLQASGFGRPVPGTNKWRAWADSMGPVIGPRGHAGLLLAPNDDRIVDLLQPTPPNLALIGNLNQRAAYGQSQDRGPVFTDITPENSWLYYMISTFVETSNGVVQVHTLPTKPRTAKGDVYGKPSAGGGVAAGAIGGAVAAIPGVLQQVFDANPVFYGPLKQAFLGDGGLDVKQEPQRRGRQSARLLLLGAALRVRYAIPAPTAEKWGDATLTPANRPDRGEGFWTGVVGSTLYPVTAAKWRLSYLLDTIPGAGAPVIPNPLFKGGGVDAANLPANLGGAIGGAIAGAFKVPGG